MAVGSDPSAATLYPLTFAPVFKDYPWGGRNLAYRLGRVLPDGIVAESWEIAAHPNGASLVRSGPLMGRSLAEVLAVWGLALVGRRNASSASMGRFPLLIKLLDANSWLSVQVHPDDSYGAAHAGEFGKTEMWVVLHAAPGSELIYGFAQKVNRESFAQAIAGGNPEPWLHRLRVQTGDVVFVPAGAIHALGPGIIVAEIQQNSDTTYRIYDWGRPRPLHIAQALDVLDFGLVTPGPLLPTRLSDAPVTELIGECPYFRTERIRLAAGEVWRGACTGETFEIWGVIEGAVTVQATHVVGTEAVCTLCAVDWVLLPAALGGFEVTAQSVATLLRVLTPPASGEQGGPDHA